MTEVSDVAHGLFKKKTVLMHLEVNITVKHLPCSVGQDSHFEVCNIRGRFNVCPLVLAALHLGL
jgi:hypothetical protein